MSWDAPNCGTITAVRGSVVDAVFPRVPAIRHVLEAGDNGEAAIEVVAHLSEHEVRGVALTPTRGLARGASIRDLGHPLRVPVGERVLGRVFDVFGETIDS